MVESRECVFCKIVRGEIKGNIFLDGDSFIAFFDKDQSVKGHMLIIPKRHFVTLLDIPDKMGDEMLSFAKKVAGKMMDEKYGDGFNVVMNNLECAGQVIMHAHLHIIPRKEGDGLRFLTKV